jgi:hypothetical protein
MKQPLTRIFKRNVLIASVVVAGSGALIGLAAGPALAQTGAVRSTSSMVTTHTTSTPMISTPAQPAPPPLPPPPPAPSSIRPGYPWHPGAWLWISVRWAPQQPTLHWFLTCSPNGGNLPNPNQICGQLHQAFQPFAPISQGTMCPMISYGPATATINGNWYGLRVFLQLNRSNGCEEAQWNRLTAALDLTPHVPGSVNPGGPIQPGPIYS